MQPAPSGNGLFSINLQAGKHKGNAKTGCPTTTSPMQTCPSTCGMRESCYAKRGPLLWHWRRISEGKSGITWDTLLQKIWDMPNDAWRHNQAGDLPGIGPCIDEYKLKQLTFANRGRKGWTYTHKWHAGGSLDYIKRAIAGGFTVNLSCDSLEEYDSLHDRWHRLPMAVVTDKPTHFSPAGDRLVTCPHQLGKPVTCATCGLCAIPDRGYGIAFLRH